MFDHNGKMQSWETEAKRNTRVDCPVCLGDGELERRDVAGQLQIKRCGVCFGVGTMSKGTADDYLESTQEDAPNFDNGGSSSYREQMSDAGRARLLK